MENNNDFSPEDLAFFSEIEATHRDFAEVEKAVANGSIKMTAQGNVVGS
jgi:hypothetical protein|tara:strand:+ start:295 stop:441 length:147 start_codon:yes stop_codon:yes gene_type:complete